MVNPAQSPRAVLVRGAGAGVERPLMDGDVQDVADLFEDVLRAVSMMDVPIHDQHAPPFRGIAGCAAATAMLLNRQNPIAQSRSA